MFLAQGPGNIIGSLVGGLQAVISYLPTLVGALLVLLVGYPVAKAVQWVVRKGLNRLHVDQRMENTHTAQYLHRMSPNASIARGSGRVAFWLIFLYALVSAISALGIPALTGFTNQVLAYLPNVIAALAIFAVAGLVAGAVAGLAKRTLGESPLGRVASTMGPVLVMVIASFMILTQLRIAPTVVLVTYSALIGALALGSALAFGLGGREVAADMLRSGYDKAREQQDELQRQRAERQDVESGTAPAQDEGWTTTAPGQAQPQPAGPEEQRRTST